ncbi:GNAT family N-acetyltransferase [Nocardioides nitrophenolicus]|uniref:GNAT family N-acetyltransferase n=1 Tax=Nocardioides nitrophenolicus TaxID=60489 RepID=UPI00195E5F14|nr:GNAT family N-acetyltransferase [Nocardioides nitrophenolicus]MBM7517684.1 GNAT superfamily N-acetyltransferase [Nocardioides nitrophenolicus]
MAALQVRPRRAADLAGLAEVLWEQQPATRYPFRDPLPIPVEQFLHAEDAAAAWTAELDGRPVGHVCRTGPPAGFAEAAAMNQACARAHGCEVAELGWVSTLFVGTGARGLGVGRLLHDTVVADIRAAGLHPCLEVLPLHAAALALYLGSGWAEVLRLRPAWLREAAGEDAPEVRVLVLPAA